MRTCCAEHADTNGTIGALDRRDALAKERLDAKRAIEILNSTIASLSTENHALIDRNNQLVREQSKLLRNVRALPIHRFAFRLISYPYGSCHYWHNTFQLDKLQCVLDQQLPNAIEGLGLGLDVPAETAIAGGPPLVYP